MLVKKLITPMIVRDQQRVQKALRLLRAAEAGLVGMGMNQTTDRVVDAVRQARDLLPRAWAEERAALENGIRALYTGGKFNLLLRSVRDVIYTIEGRDTSMIKNQSAQQHHSRERSPVFFVEDLVRFKGFILSNREVNFLTGYAMSVADQARRYFSPEIASASARIWEKLKRWSKRNALGQIHNISRNEAAELVRDVDNLIRLVKAKYGVKTKARKALTSARMIAHQRAAEDARRLAERMRMDFRELADGYDFGTAPYGTPFYNDLTRVGKRYHERVMALLWRNKGGLTYHIEVPLRRLIDMLRQIHEKGRFEVDAPNRLYRTAMDVRQQFLDEVEREQRRLREQNRARNQRYRERRRMNSAGGNDAN